MWLQTDRTACLMKMQTSRIITKMLLISLRKTVRSRYLKFSTADRSLTIICGYLMIRTLKISKLLREPDACGIGLQAETQERPEAEWAGMFPHRISRTNMSRE